VAVPRPGDVVVNGFGPVFRDDGAIASPASAPYITAFEILPALYLPAEGHPQDHAKSG